MKYFAECKCLEDVKETYRKLCFEYHPDISKHPNATEIMKQVNNEYELAFSRWKNTHRNAQKEYYTTERDNTETSEEFRDIINQLIHFVGIKIEIIGKWIWISGNTFPYKKELKELKFSWVNNKRAWAYHRPEDSKLTRKKYSFDDIRNMFGSLEIETKDQAVLQS